MQIEYKKLNVGCGNDIKPGWVNMDIAPLPGVDVVHNIEILPLPFDSDSMDEILCQDVLEHVDYIPLLKELNRILRPGGTIKIRVPHFSCVNNYIDPTHKKLFSWKTFLFFTKNSYLGRNYYFDFSFKEYTESKITFSDRRIYFYNFLVKKLININEKTKDIYEESFLSRFFPALNIEITLKK